MDKQWEEQCRAGVKSDVNRTMWTKEQEDRILGCIHREIEEAEQISPAAERRKIMRLSKKSMIAAAAAVIMAVGGISAVAAGRAAGFMSSTSHDDMIRSVAEMEKRTEQTFDREINILDQLGGVFHFQEGSITEVKAVDEDMKTVGAYPEAGVYYGDVFLSIKKPNEFTEEPMAFDSGEIYDGIQIQYREDNYLFLPPDAEPSAEDRKLEEEGKLFISYGSEQAERKVFRYAAWQQDGMEYLLSTFGSSTMDEMMDMAREYIDAN